LRPAAAVNTVACMTSDTSPIVLLPGGVLPAALAYGPLLEVLGDDVEAIAKDFELYTGEQPPADFTLELEVGGVLRTATEAGFDRFHLVGYSGGGACSLVFATRNPERLLSLALIEPAWAGNNGQAREERACWQEFDRISALPDRKLMRDFVRVQLRAGVQPPPPPPGPQPPWMAKRPAGLKTFINAFRTEELDLDALRRFDPPVYFALGGLSNPDYYARMADRLAGILPDLTVDTYEDRHHFDPPHRAEPRRLADALHAHWARAQTRSEPVAR
jgi:pimeloyl-ACP methyl ester carboxylesterase